MRATILLRGRRARVLQVALLIGLLITGAVIFSGNSEVQSQVPGPQTDPIPVIDFANPPEAMAVRLEFSGQGDVELVSAEVVPGPARSRISNPPLLEVQARGHQGNLVEEFNAWNPLWSFVRNADGSESKIVRDHAVATFIFPFSPHLSTMTVSDVELGQELIAVDLDPAIQTFCEDSPDDPACSTDLAISKSDGLPAGSTAVAGAELTYTLSVSNAGESPARGVTVVDTLPEGVTFQGYDSAEAECLEDPAGTLTCDLLEALPAGESVKIAIDVAIAAGLVYNNGGPIEIINQATVTFAGTDSNMESDSTSESTVVVAEADLEIVSFAQEGAIIDALVGQPVDIELDKVITNHGPSAPMDVAVDVASAASAGLSVTPDTANPAEATAVGLDEQREVTERFTLTCQAPGEQSVQFTNTINPLDPAGNDPDQSNNSSTVDVTVNCVVPVMVNIKPGSAENPINFKGRGVIPLAILSTAPGEYGLPQAFDATRIDPQSVRFGPAGRLFDLTDPAGASETHNRGHVEDSLELDEQTRDGDEDMVLHFRLEGSGLVPGDTEACVRGSFTEPNGESFTFFGCDAISTRP